MKTGHWSGGSVEEAGRNVEHVDGAWNEMFQVERALFLRHVLPLASVNQRLVDANVLVAIAMHTFVRDLNDRQICR